MNEKKFAALISILSNTFLTTLKFVAGLVSGSVSLLSEALHSLGDLLASFIAMYSVTKSDEPADIEHQFGHGKYEDLAGFIEAGLILISGFFIIYMGLEKIILQNSSFTFSADLAAAVMIASVVLNYIVGTYLVRCGKKTDSNALLGDGHHLLADVLSSLGVTLGLIAVKFTGHYILDPIIAIMMGMVILRTGFNLIKKTSNNLLDGSLPKEEVEAVKEILDSYKEKGLMGVKSVKTSKSGSTKNIVLVIYLPCEISFRQVHLMCDEIESAIEAKLNKTNVVIHAEPACSDETKHNCKTLC